MLLRSHIKEGVRVKLTTFRYRNSNSNPIWGWLSGKVGGTIIKVYESTELEVRWDNGAINGYSPQDLSLLLSRGEEANEIIKLFEENHE